MNAKCLALAGLILCSLPLRAQVVNHDLKKGEKHVDSLMIMPVQAELTKLGMKGPEVMTEESLQFQKALTWLVANVLEKAGYSVDAETLSSSALQQNPALRYSVDDLQKKFDATLKLMSRKSGDVRKGRFSLGDDVANLPASSSADALLFVRANGRVLTTAKRAFNLFTTILCFDTVRMDFAVVDAKTGSVLYFARPMALRNVAKNPAGNEVTVREAFKDFVKASPPAKTAAQRNAAQPSAETTAESAAKVDSAKKPEH